MKTNRIFASLAIALVGMVMIGSATFAQQKPGNRGQKLAQKLDLTDAQKEQIKVNREKFKTDNAAALAEIKTLRQQLKQQIQNKDVDGAKATKAQLKEKMQALKPTREAMGQQMKQILTAEQQQKLQELRAERKENVKDRRQDWKEKHQGNGGVN